MIIDTHTHLYDSDFDSDRDLVVKRAKGIGVVKCVMPAIDISYHQKMIDCAKQYEGFAYPCIGLHPTSVKNDWKEELSFVEENLNKGGFCAIGEIGMDGYWSKELLQEQIEVFERQLLLSIKYDLPVIIHSRDATNEIFEAFDFVKKQNIGRLKGTFHAYAGSIETYHRILSYGDFKFGIGGVITYKNASVAETLKNIPLTDILLETDSPWLSPVPFRGKRNESSYLCHIVNKIASIKECSPQEIENVTTMNAKELFKLN